MTKNKTGRTFVTKAFSFHPDDYAELKELAQDNGMPVSALLRMILRKGIADLRAIGGIPDSTFLVGRSNKDRPPHD